MEIEITSLLETDCFPLSHSVAEGGENAGRNTWNNAKEQAGEAPLLKTPEELQSAREYFKSFGAWSEDEIAAWNDQEINALFLQFIAGDVREMGADSLSEIDWKEAEELQSNGQAPSNIFRSNDGRVFFYLGS